MLRRVSSIKLFYFKHFITNLLYYIYKICASTVDSVNCFITAENYYFIIYSMIVLLKCFEPSSIHFNDDHHLLDKHNVASRLSNKTIYNAKY